MKSTLSVIVLVLTMFYVFPTLVFSQETQKIDKKLEDIAGKYAQCTAYYELVSKALEVSGNAEKAESYKQMQNISKMNSLLLASEGRDKDMAVLVNNSRIDMYKNKMKGEVSNRAENISLLIDKYHFGCQEVIESPPAELKAVLAKERNETEKQSESTYDLTVNGKSCVEGQSQQIECTYQVGKDLKIAIAGIGQPDTSITFMKSNFDGDFYATHGLLHRCIIIKRGAKGITNNQINGPGSITDYAFISPQNGKVYTNWKDCQSAY